MRLKYIAAFFLLTALEGITAETAWIRITAKLVMLISLEAFIIGVAGRRPE
jgi:hypothetical protein